MKSQDSTHRDPESVSKRRAKGRAKGPSPWTTVTTAYTYVGAAMELLGHILMRRGKMIQNAALFNGMLMVGLYYVFQKFIMLSYLIMFSEIDIAIVT